MSAGQGCLSLAPASHCHRGVWRSLVVVLACGLGACREGEGGEPSAQDIQQAYAKALDAINAKGGMRINMGSAGGDQTIAFQMQLHAIDKKTCTGKDRVYTCEVTTRMSYPPVKHEIETRDASLVLFDGPGGWRVVD